MSQTPRVYGLWILHDDGFHRRFPDVKAPMYDHGSFEASDTLAFVFTAIFFHHCDANDNLGNPRCA